MSAQAYGESEQTNNGADTPKVPVMTSNEIIVKFKPTIAEILIDNLNQPLGAFAIHSNSLLGIDVLKNPSDVLVQDAINQYKASGLVEYTEPNFVRTTSNISNDPLFDNQWNLSNENDSDIDAPEAWDVQSDCPASLSQLWTQA